MTPTSIHTAERRARILAEAQRAVVRRGQRRHSRRRAIAASVCITAAAGTSWLVGLPTITPIDLAQTNTTPTQGSSTMIAPRDGVTTRYAVERTGLSVHVVSPEFPPRLRYKVADAPSERYATFVSTTADPQRVRSASLDDDELLALLRDCGVTAGISRFRDHTVVLNNQTHAPIRPEDLQCSSAAFR